MPPVVMMTCVARLGELRPHLRGDLGGVVLHQAVPRHLVAGFFEQLPDREPARIRFRRAGVAHGQDVARHRPGGVRLVLGGGGTSTRAIAHAAIIGLADVPRPSLHESLTI